jgi:hypothetical protein
MIHATQTLKAFTYQLTGHLELLWNNIRWIQRQAQELTEGEAIQTSFCLLVIIVLDSNEFLAYTIIS